MRLFIVVQDCYGERCWFLKILLFLSLQTTQRRNPRNKVHTYETGHIQNPWHVVWWGCLEHEHAANMCLTRVFLSWNWNTKKHMLGTCWQHVPHCQNCEPSLSMGILAMEMLGWWNVFVLNYI